MKKILFVIVLFICFFGNAQVSTIRMNDIKLGMKLSDFENLTGKKVKFKVDNHGHPVIPVFVELKGVFYKVTLISDSLTNQLSDKFYVYSIESSDPSLKTLSGVKVGSTLDDLYSKYKNYTISIFDGHDGKTNQRTKAFRYFTLFDKDEETTLKFRLVNNKVVSIEIFYENKGLYY